jgi:hypothetical protein
MLERIGLKTSPSPLLWRIAWFFFFEKKIKILINKFIKTILKNDKIKTIQGI